MKNDLSLEETLAKALDSEPGRNLLSPFTRELGQLFGAIASIARFYATDNLRAIFTKWAKSRFENDRTIEATDFQRIMPLLPNASMQSDGELQTRWAALLESTVENPDDVLPSFGQTLAHINAEEAKFLDRFVVATSVKTHTIVFGGQMPGEMSYDDVLCVFDPSLARQSNPLQFGYDLYKDDRNPELMSHAELLIDDLVRMGIISARVDAITSGDEMLDTATFQWYSLSPYGRKFIQAVSPGCRC